MGNLLEEITAKFISINNKSRGIYYFRNICADTKILSVHKVPDGEKISLGHEMTFEESKIPCHIIMRTPKTETDFTYVEEFNILLAERSIKGILYQITFKVVEIGDVEIYEISYHALDSVPLHSGTIHPIP